MRSSENASSKIVLVEIMENISLLLMECVRTVSIFYSNRTAQALDTVIPYPHLLMPPYIQRGQVISIGMTLQTTTYPIVPHERFYCQLRQNFYLRLTYGRFIVLIITRMSTNIYSSTARPEFSRLYYLQGEPLNMVPRPIFDPFIDYTDAVVMDKRKGLGYEMEPEDNPRVGEYIHLHWQDDHNCYPCRIVYYNLYKDYTTVIYGKREQYAIEYVSMRNGDWHYIVYAQKSERGEDP